MTDGVVLLHGLGHTPASLWGAQAFLEIRGFATLNLGYPSRRVTVEENAARLAPRVKKFAAKIDGEVHFLTHSMGGLVAWALIAREKPPNLGKVVMLAPPLGGSEIADFIAASSLLRPLFGPAIDDLTCSARRGPIDFPLGVIAGDRTLNPLLSFLFLRGPNDGKVTVARTRLPGVADHVSLPVAHPLIPWDPDALRQAVAFFRNGAFERGRLFAARL
jgi:pimeloyl-ACP methyl ester carboxylesterase